MTPNKLRNAIDESFTLLDKACSLAGLEYTALTRALDASLEGERAHRKMVRGIGTYNVGAALAAKSIVVGKVVQALENPPLVPKTWVGATLYRRDMLLAFAIAEGVKSVADCKAKRSPEQKLRQADLRICLERLLASTGARIDYAEDIAC